MKLIKTKQHQQTTNVNLITATFPAAFREYLFHCSPKIHWHVPSCVDPGIFVRGVQARRQEYSLEVFFSDDFTEKNYTFPRTQRGPTFSMWAGGPTISREGGGGGRYSPMDPHMYVPVPPK